MLSYWLSIIRSFKDYKEAAQARLSLQMSNATLLEITCRGSYVNSRLGFIESVREN